MAPFSSQNTNGSTYDFVIIGAGLGGLFSGLILAKEGFNVIILEKNKQLGGALQTFALDKKVFDSCVHYIGDLKAGSTLHRLFQYAGIYEDLQLQALNENGFDQIQFSNEPTTYPLANGHENFIEQLLPFFPNEKNNLRLWQKHLTDINSHFHLYHLKNGSATDKNKVTSLSLTNDLNTFIPNKKLQAVLTGNSLLYTGQQKITPTYLHSLVTESYVRSAHKIKPGSSEIAKALHRQLLKNGATIYKNAEVTKLNGKNKTIEYAQLDSGEKIYGKNFISNVHPQALNQILDPAFLKPAYRKRIQGLPQTPAPFLINLSLKSKSVPHQNWNTYWHQDEQTLKTENTQNTWPHTLALYYNEAADHPGFSESLSVLTYADFHWMAPFHNTYNHSGNEADRGEQYHQLKDRLSEKVLKKIVQIRPELDKNIKKISSASPLTFRDYLHKPMGTIYGQKKDVQHLTHSSMAVRTPVSNLYQTGENINLHGVLGVCITALATCGELVGLDYLLKKVNG